MKIISLFLLTGFLSLFADTVHLVHTDHYIQCEFHFDSLSTKTSKDAGTAVTHIRLADLDIDNTPGMPRLPFQNVTLGVPPQSKISLQIVEKNSVLKNFTVPFKEGTLSEQHVDSWLPAKSVKVITDGYIRDQQIVQLRVSPFRYHPLTKQCEWTQKLIVRVLFDQPAKSTGQPIENPVAEKLLKNLLQNYSESKSWRSARQPALSKTTAQPLGQVRIAVKEEGIYRVTGQDLIDAGVDLSEIQPTLLDLTIRFKPVPFVIEGIADGRFDADDKLIFIGTVPKSDNTERAFYTDTNIYMLKWGQKAGARFWDVSKSMPEGMEVRSSAWSTVFREFDETYQRLVNYKDESADHWFWVRVKDTDPFSYILTLPDLMKSSHLRIHAGLHGLTESQTVTNNHHLVIHIDGEQVAEGYGSQALPFELHSATFQLQNTDETHNVNFSLPLDNPQVFGDHAFLNWFTVEYERLLNLHNGVLNFDYNPILTGIYEIGNVSDEKIYVLTKNGYVVDNPYWANDNDKSVLRFVFDQKDADIIYISKESTLKTPQFVLKSNMSTLASSDNAADYIIITHHDFRQQAEQLAAHRQSQGLRTKIVNVQDIYDEFADGLYDPPSIRTFLQKAFQNWQKPAPLYVLLLGDTSYYMNKNLAEKTGATSFVPSMMRYTSAFGMTSSDNYFAAISGNDELPDMYIGRLPAKTADQAQEMVDKIISYDQQPAAAEWRRHLTLAAGNGDFFRSSSQHLVDNVIPKSYAVQQVSTEYDTRYYVTTEEFIKLFNDGQLVLNFLVHGASEQIADARLLTKDDLIRLDNPDKLPFAVTMSCYIGHFDHPEETSLGEALLLEPEKGVIALYGSAGQAYQYADFHLNNAMFDGIYNQGLLDIGASTTFAKFELIRQVGGYWDAVRNFVLLGDPATRLIIPQDSIAVDCQKKVYYKGDELQISGSLPDVGDGKVFLTVVNDVDSVIYSTELAVDDGEFSATLFKLDDDKRSAWPEDGGYGWVRVYYQNALQSFVGSAAFGIAKAFVDFAGTIPENPMGFEPFKLELSLQQDVGQALGGIDSVQAAWSLDRQNWTVLPMQFLEGEYVSTETLAFEVARTVYFKFDLFSSKGKITTDIFSQKIYFFPDLVFLPGLGITGDDQPHLTIPIRNQSESGVRDILVVASLDSAGEPEVGRTVITEMAAFADTVVRIPISQIPAGTYAFQIEIDPDSTIREEEEGNNYYPATISVFTKEQGSYSAAQFLNNSVSVTVPPQAVSGYASCRVEFYDDSQAIDAAKKSSLTPILDDHFQTTLFYQLTMSDTSQTFVKPVQIHIFPKIAQPLDAKICIYTFDPETLAWFAQPTLWSESDSILSAYLPVGSHYFAPMCCNDDDPPNVQISVEGQNFVDGDRVPKNPVFIISFSDSSGILLDNQSFEFSADGESVQPENYTLLKNPEHNRSAVLTWAPQLRGDIHQLAIRVSDVNANTRSVEASFQLAREFGLDFLANHPNPFYDETIFAFQLQDVAEEVKIDIYTVSGRMIRSFTLYDIAGYYELEWDARDKDGREIANGVYYCRYTAKQGDKKIERIVKIAKLQ